MKSVREHIYSKEDIPLVSISCMTFNHVDYIVETLEGFLNQKTSFPIEILIHDDCSLDGTTEIIKEYENKFPLIIKVEYETENQWKKGRKGSVLFNFPRAIGKYIAICEGDDYWTDSFKLEKQIKALEENEEIAISMTKVRGLQDETGLEVKIRELIKPKSDSIYEFKDYLMYRFSQTSSFVLRKSCYNYNILRKYYCGDQAMVLNVALNGKIHYLNEYTSVYRINRKSISFKGDSSKKRESMLKFYNEVNTLTDYKYHKLVKVHLIYHKYFGYLNNNLLQKIFNYLYISALKFNKY